MSRARYGLRRRGRHNSRSSGEARDYYMDGTVNVGNNYVNPLRTIAGTADTGTDGRGDDGLTVAGVNPPDMLHCN